MAESISSIIDELDQILDYEETGSVADAKRVISLCNRLLVRRPESAGHGGSSYSYSSDQLKAMIDDARVYVKSSRPGSRVRYLSGGWRGGN